MDALLTLLSVALGCLSAVSRPTQRPSWEDNFSRKSTNANIWEAAYLGNVAASVQVSKTGNVPIIQSELEAHLSLGIKKQP